MDNSRCTKEPYFHFQEILLNCKHCFTNGINGAKIYFNHKKTIDWINETEKLILRSKNIKILKDTLVTTYNFVNHLIALEDKSAGKKIDTNKSEFTLHKIRTTTTILANGHIERFISFRNNDLPGVMLASSFEKYIHRFGVIPEKKPVIFISGHFANFELMSMEITKKKINLATIYRPLNNFFLNPFMEHVRKANNLKL